MGNSFLDTDTSNVPDLEPVAGDQEVQVRIVGFRTDDDDNTIRTDKNGDAFIMPIYEIQDEPNAPEFSDYIGLDDSDEKKRNNKLRKLKNWKACFGIPDGGADLDEAVGNQGWIIVGLKNDAEYGPQNFVKRYVAGK